MDYKITINYNKNENNLLSSLSEKYGSDKGATRKDTVTYFPWGYHTYTDFYAMLFDHCRFDVRNVFECGIGTTDESIESNMTSNGIPGASLRMWRDYFPNANIYGADIDDRILFEEERIRTFYMDQTSISSIENVLKNLEVSFDAFIDDGLHEYHAGITLYENAMYKIKDGGIYIIEDVSPSNLQMYEKYFTERNVSFKSVLLTGMLTEPDNTVIIIDKK